MSTTFRDPTGSFSDQTTFVRNADIFASNIDDEVVMMDEAAGLYFGLNPVAGTIWTCLATPLSLEALLNQLTENYDVSREQCQSEVCAFLTDMVHHKLIQVIQPE